MSVPSWYSDVELVSFLDYSCEDPVVKRLATMLVPYVDLLKRMDEIGLSPDLEFDGLHIIDYIDRKDDEIEYLHTEINRLTDEVQELNARTVIDLLTSINKKLADAQGVAELAERRLREAQTRETELRKKLSMWAKLNGNLSEQY